jgi:23S rRNA (pseudouridine1915-N3)-methyltransferase
MQKIVLLTIGRLKESWAQDAAAFYGDRLKRVLKLEVMELPASRETDPERQRQDESRRILKFIDGYDADIIVLDEKGKTMTSPAFAADINHARDTGRTLLFILGGSYGLTDEVRAAGKTLRLSDMVLPHELCRIVFLEQLYRATEINRGSDYHH